MENFIKEQYATKLHSLHEKNMITSEIMNNFLKRGLQIINTRDEFHLDAISKILPFIVIGASKAYIDNLSIPYQATSYVAAESGPESGRYIYKIPGKKGGGVRQLTGGQRKFGDNLYASTHKIMMGYEGILFSIYNLLENKEQTGEWTFYASHLQKSFPDVYEDLQKLNDLNTKQNSQQYFIIVARSSKSFQRSGIIDTYLKNQIKILQQSARKIIFLTDQTGYDFSSKVIKEKDNIIYVTTGESFNIYKGLSYLKKKYNIKMILNDGGRIMSNGLKKSGVIGEERITLEPYPGKEFLDFQKDDDFLLKECTLGIKGSGLDGTELTDAFMLYSTKIKDESANVYVYPLDDYKFIS